MQCSSLPQVSARASTAIGPRIASDLGPQASTQRPHPVQRSSSTTGSHFKNRALMDSSCFRCCNVGRWLVDRWVSRCCRDGMALVGSVSQAAHGQLTGTSPARWGNQSARAQHLHLGLAASNLVVGFAACFDADQCSRSFSIPRRSCQPMRSRAGVERNRGPFAGGPNLVRFSQLLCSDGGRRKPGCASRATHARF